MAPQRLRWTPEEEASLRAGVAKYGTGKWRAILNDPQFHSALRCRSNVDLKDKWRNMKLPATNSSSSQKGKTGVKKSRSTHTNDDHAMAIVTVPSDTKEEILDVMPLAAWPGEAFNA